MLTIDKEGRVSNPRIKLQLVSGLGVGRLGVVHGIVVHQTGGSSAQAAIAGYRTRPLGTHFLIDKDGTIYQTASLLYYTNHIGMLKPRCMMEHKCSPVEMQKYSKFNPKGNSRLENKKDFPARYPANRDSIGIELVGEFIKPEKRYVNVTNEQNSALQWLVREISQTLHVSMSEIYRHPALSYKEKTEAETARW